MYKTAKKKKRKLNKKILTEILSHIIESVSISKTKLQ